jgi:LPS-assembly lipoprotein
MWLPIFKKSALLVAFLALSACGFHPVYGSHGDDGSPVTEDQLSLVSIDPIPEHSGQMLRNDLLDRFNSNGRPDAPEYYLTVKLRVTEEDLGTLANATSALAAVHAYGDYSLKDRAGKVLVTGTTSSTAQYDKLASMYGTLAAHDSAIERTVNELSEQLTARISLFFSEPKSPEP